MVQPLAGKQPGLNLGEMRHRQRVLAALAHRQPDRVPIDFGSTIVTSITLPAYQRLKKFLGEADLREEVMDRYANLAQVDEEILERYGVDTRGVRVDAPFKPASGSASEYGEVDAWGIVRQKSADTGTYFVNHGPLEGEINRQTILNHPWPEPDPAAGVEIALRRIQDLRRQGDWAVVLSLPTNFILTSMELRGFEDWYRDAALDPQLLGFLLDQVLEIQVECAGKILEKIGEMVDVVVNFDDLAMQDRLIVSPACFGSLLAPRLKRLFDFIHGLTSAKILHHSDGAIKPLLKNLIELGVDAVNPVQVSAKGMGDLKELKSTFGRDLTFWGGIDTQWLLPFGSPAEIRAETIRTLEVMNQDGGYVLASVHNIQEDVPPENIQAIYEAVFE